MNGQAIRRSIAATDKIRKITKAMQLVSANHLAHAVHIEANGKPYVAAIDDIISYWMIRHKEMQHPFFVQSPLLQQLVVIFSSDRGLCGALNLNTFKVATERMAQDAKEFNIKSTVITVGEKALNFFGRGGMDLYASVTKLGNHPTLSQLSGIITLITDGYHNKQWQRVVLVYPSFVNTMVQKPVIETLLPITQVLREHPKSIMDAIDYIYEPTMPQVVDVLLEHYMNAHIHQAALEMLASEQAARMVAMQNATDNAETCKKDLERDYNKARQAAITQEIAEITAGSEAL